MTDRPTTLRALDVLRRVEAVLSDPEFTPAEARAVAFVVVSANREQGGLSWPGRRRIAAETGTSPQAITSGLEKAIARKHLCFVGRSAHGVYVFRIVPVERGIEGVQSQAGSGSKGEPLSPDPSGSKGEPLPDASGSTSGSSPSASGSILTGQRFHGGTGTIYEPTKEPGGNRTSSSPSIHAPSQEANSDDNADRDVEAVVQAWIRLRGPLSGAEPAFRDAARKALASRATARAIETLICRLGPTDRPWTACHQAREAVTKARAEFGRLFPSLDGWTLAQIWRAQFDVSVPDGLSKQADLDDWKRRWAWLFAPTGEPPTATALPSPGDDEYGLAFVEATAGVRKAGA